MKKKVGEDIQFLTALDEENHVIVQANAPIAQDGNACIGSCFGSP